MNITEEIATTAAEVDTTAGPSELTKFLGSKLHIYRAFNFYSQMTISSICVPLNIYFICCVLTMKNLRNVRYVLIVWQAVCDIISIGFLRAFLTIQNKHRELYIRIYHNHGFEWYFFYQVKLKCLIGGLSVVVNEYSTGFVMLFYAIERFILIIFPLRAKTILTKRNYKICSIAIIVVGAALMLAGGLAEWMLLQKGRLCGEGPRSFWIKAMTKYTMDISIFFATPAAMSVLLYGVIIKRLLSKPKVSKSSDGVQGTDGQKKLSEKEKRNRALTKAFIVSTVAWIILWSLFYSEEIRDAYDLRDILNYNYWSFSKSVIRELFFSLYSIVNPFCFIIINRQFQEPILKLIRLLPFAKEKV